MVEYSLFKDERAHYKQFILEMKLNQAEGIQNTPDVRYCL